MSTSKLQRKFSMALSQHFGGFTIRENMRPEWCLGDDFQRLELDFWIIELDVAVEIQGGQHYVYTPHFHSTYDGFLAQQARDEAKKKRCKDYGILLLEVDDEITFNDAIEQIRALEKAKKFQAKPIHEVTPEQWRERIRGIHGRFRHTFNHVHGTPYSQFARDTSHLHNKLYSWIRVYGMGIFKHVGDELVAELFFYAQKCYFKRRDLKSKKKAEKNRKRKER